MLLTRTLIVVFVAFYGVVYSSPNQTYVNVTYVDRFQTYNSTDPTSIHPLYTKAGLTSQTSRTLMVIETHFKELRNASTQPDWKNVKSRGKRSMFNLFSMIGCATECSWFHLLSYGNYCGWGGSGRPLNNVDRCCMWHDHCYSRVMDDFDKWSFSLHFRGYNWYCNRGDLYCDRYQNGQWRWETCQCDLKLIKCLNKYGCPYNLKPNP